METISLHKVALPDTYRIFFLNNSTIINDQDLIVSGNNFKDENMLGIDMFYAKISLDGELKLFKKSEENGLVGTIFKINSNPNQIGLFQMTNKINPNINIAAIFLLDSVFNKVMIQYYPEQIIYENDITYKFHINDYGNVDVKQLTENELLISARIFEDWTTKNIYNNKSDRSSIIFKTDDDFEMKQSVKAISNNDSIEFPAYSSSIGIVDINNIYHCINTNIQEKKYPYQYEPSAILVSKFDSALNVKWKKYYELDNIYYSSHYILPTSDGGCLITGFQFDFNNSNNRHDLFVLKINSDGSVDMEESQATLVNKLFVYPNLVKSRFQIRLPNSEIANKISVYNNIGTLIVEQNAIQEVNLQNLSAGMYFVVVETASGKTYSEKIIKN